MLNFKRYRRNPVVNYPEREWPNKEIEKAPIWCSVDLRDGNQALIEPMSLEEKLEFFQLLLDVGFKEIEVGFPAASETEYQFLRTLIDKNMIPDDVTIQVLTQAREHIIRKTFEAIDGAPHAVVHMYNSTSVNQREQVFRKSKEEIKQIAINGATLLNELAKEVKGDVTFEYSPESFTGTEVDYALDVCNAVLDIWQPRPDRKIIINLPATIETSLPHVYASQVEYMHKNLKYRENVIISLHPHNDRGCGVADAELGLLAGADRIEGTLFGNGERTGNVDIITLGMNMFAHGVDPVLNFRDMKRITEIYERVTRMQVHPRQPYGGALVFSAFSGSHQDAIAKGMAYRQEKQLETWSVPYLPIDPVDVGRTYDSDVIRINSQSGKGGVSYILKQSFGIALPDKMKEEFGYLVKDVSDKEHKELTPEWIYSILEYNYVDVQEHFTIDEFHFMQKHADGGILGIVTMTFHGQTQTITAEGNGRLDAVSKALKKGLGFSYELTDYKEHALSKGSSSKAMSYVAITHMGRLTWGIGIDDDIIESSIEALCAAINRLPVWSK